MRHAIYARLFVVVGVVVLLGVGCGAAPSSDPEPAQSEPVVESQPDPEPVVEPPPEPETAWRTTQSTNLLDDSTTVVSVLEATTGTGGMLDPEPITLVVRCSSNTTDAYINWHDFLGDDDIENVRSTRKRVTYRFPPVPAQTEMWSVSTDNDSTFVRRAIPFLRRMVESEQLIVCGRLRKCKPFSEALLLRSVCSSGSPRQRSGSPAPRLFPWNEGQPSGWPARTSRTVGRGCHPQGRNGVEEPRSGLTAAGDRARGRRFRAKRGPLGTSEAVHRRFRKLHFVGWFGACGQVLSCVRPH